MNCSEVTTIVENQNINIEKPMNFKQIHWNKFKFNYFIIITLFIYFLLFLFIDLLGFENIRFIRFDLIKEHECDGSCILIIIIPIILILINVGLTISLMKKKSKKAMILLIIFLSLFMLFCLYCDIKLISNYKNINKDHYDYMRETFKFLPDLTDKDKKILIMKIIYISYMIISILTCGFGVFSLISLYKKFFTNNELNEKNNKMLFFSL